jgi:hypothetical protein
LATAPAGVTEVANEVLGFHEYLPNPVEAKEHWGEEFKPALQKSGREFN